ncbi:redoxin domain-containing protein [Halohasta litorea]|uniref:Redoxin domain-containing protein n=1 Tax=Halohasta litorea TaxID=869891 RepID=A0ABD6D5W6_9EURY|nr:peroxiredoxin [Halohasta litorea]
MASTGNQAPDFTAPLVSDDDTVATTFSDHLGSGPVVLAFFPAAFSTTCTEEVCTFRDQLARFNDVGATVFGVSTDTSYALERFREENGLTFGLLSDNDGSIIEAYDLVDDHSFADKGLTGVATRSVFVVDAAGTIQYVWIADNPGQEPDYEVVVEAVESLAN